MLFIVGAAIVLAGSCMAMQPEAIGPDYSEKLRELEVGKLNFMHTTDTHGWYLGHTTQAGFSADWGDYISFQQRMKERAQDLGGDLVFVDSGDRHDGNGLSDLSTPHGRYSDLAFREAEYDVVTLGNHELYLPAVSQFEYEQLVPYYGESFISTNVKFNDGGVWKTFGNSTHRYWETPVNNYHILALSFMFDFTPGNNPLVQITPIAELIEQDWFEQLLGEYSQKPVDVLLVVGHLPVTKTWSESLVLHEHLRQWFPNTQIQYFGGHSHIRDFAVYDEKSTALQSGKYCETVGWLSLGDDDTLQRRYIDFNRHSFLHHSNTTSSTFDTEKGLQLTRHLSRVAQKLDLSELYGYIPYSLYMASADYDAHDKQSLLRFLEDNVLVNVVPKQCSPATEAKGRMHEEGDSENHNRMVLLNSGSIRYDMYKGPFTKNSLFTVSPFPNEWKIVPGVPAYAAQRMLKLMNDGPLIIKREQETLPSLLSPYQETVNAMATKGSAMSTKDNRQSPLSPHSAGYHLGYVTHDDFGADGDDTLHRELNFYKVPNVIASFERNPSAAVGLKTDVIYYDFMDPHIKWALKAALGSTKAGQEEYEWLVKKIGYYNDCPQSYNVGQLLKRYVENKWGS